LLKDSNDQVTGVKVENQETGDYLKGKAIINATGVFTNAIMKLNDTVYKKILSQVKEFILYLINLSTERCPDDSKR
jgi:glycerol-3-phosphate dehydrogenase